MNMTRTIIALFAISLAAGCAKRDASYSSEAAYPSEGMAMEDGAYAGDYDEAFGDEADDAEYAREASPVAPGGGMNGMSGMQGKKMSSNDGIAPGGSPAPEHEPAKPKRKSKADPGPGTEPGSNAKDKRDGPEPIARQMIYTAQMRLAVFNVDEAMARVEGLALSVNGYVQQMRQGYYILRIPAAALRGVMDGVGGLGMVTERSLEARDVTEEFVDVKTRIRVLRETQDQLVTLLKRARTVEEALHVRQALDQVTMQLEQALGRLRVLESMIGFSTLTVYVEERGPQNDIPSSNDPFPWVDSLGVEATEWN